MKPRILVVEDEPTILDNITYSLGTEGFEPHGCATGGEARAALSRGPWALVVLDVGLPDVVGFDLCREIRRTSNLPSERREKFVTNIQAEARRLQNIIDRLLALSALESRKQLDHPESIPVADLAHAVCAQLQPAAEARNLLLDLTCDARPEVLAESFLLESALHNLLQNVIDFPPDGGCIRIRVSSDAAAHTAEVTVEDEGPGIPDYALPRLFERFYSLARPGTGRKSSGLGLCFVREAAALHGGSIAVENRPDSHGTRATLRQLPLIARAFYRKP